MAIGESRFQAKQAQRAASSDVGWTISTGKIHSHTTRKVYQQHALAFINWARTTHGITRLAWLDERAGQLAGAHSLRPGMWAAPGRTARSAGARCVHEQRWHTFRPCQERQGRES